MVQWLSATRLVQTPFYVPIYEAMALQTVRSVSDRVRFITKVKWANLFEAIQLPKMRLRPAVGLSRTDSDPGHDS